MPDCVYLSKDLVRINSPGSTCCGNTSDVRRCLSDNQSSDYCLPGRDFAGTVDGFGDVNGEQKKISAVSCYRCPFQLFPIEDVNAPPISPTKRAWLKIQNEGRSYSIRQENSVVTGPAPEPVDLDNPVRNLLFHAWPTKSGLWRMSIADLMRRIDMFNGKRVLGIAVDESTEDPKEVIRAFEGKIDEVFVSENRGLQELHSFPQLLAAVESLDDQHVTFYAHTKGSQYDVSSELAISGQLWGDVMRETCLDYWPLVKQILGTKAMAGSFKKIGLGFPGIPCDWHYSGTHYWFRNRDVYQRNWKMIDVEWYGTEIWPSIMFRIHETGTVFYDGTVPELNLYSKDYWRNMVSPDFDSWRERHKRYKEGTCHTMPSSYLSSP